MERWREIPGLEGYYAASDHGRIKSLGRVIIRKNGWPMPVNEKIMTPSKGNQYGHLYVTIRKGSQRWYSTVHGLVAKTFLGPPPPGQEVLHLDEGHLVNAVTNMKYGTRKENLNMSDKVGRNQFS